MKHSHLDQLVESGSIRAYEYAYTDIKGYPLAEWSIEEAVAERLILEFHDGNTLHIDSHPGFGEKALLFFSINPRLSQE